MNGYRLNFFVEQNRKHRHHMLWEYLIDLARKSGMRGATAIAANMGFGHDGRVHSVDFFELADRPMEVAMIGAAAEVTAYLELLEHEQIVIFYSKSPVEFGWTCPDQLTQAPAGDEAQGLS